MTGNNVSHANNKTKRTQIPNLKVRKVFSQREQKWYSIRLSTKAIKTMDLMGFDAYLKKAGFKSALDVAKPVLIDDVSTFSPVIKRDMTLLREPLKNKKKSPKKSPNSIGLETASYFPAELKSQVSTLSFSTRQTKNFI